MSNNWCTNVHYRNYHLECGSPLAEWNECALSTSHQRRIRGNWTMRMHFHSSVLQVIQFFWCVLAAGGDSVRLVWLAVWKEGKVYRANLKAAVFYKQSIEGILWASTSLGRSYASCRIADNRKPLCCGFGLIKREQLKTAEASEMDLYRLAYSTIIGLNLHNKG